ncbi:aldo/keto reductase [Actinomycetospora sp. TBRC 11914]|uniref:aldo/keto reductase n=1 Tax=Actinomycetospora sp. TBRC 11914 TaxID=2729387 RepID=UPI00145FCD9E|nr:aldo/keto reductase [Actinomycetospora sp. TBRC 11914]NMO89252.1 aldo/keto reductase [Actinomycetospora sp. TBRC 11914]
MTGLPTRTLGDLTVSALGVGAMVLSPGMYGEIDDATGEAALRAAVDAGATLVDTSDGYGADGHNERLVGRALAPVRDEVAIATKFGMRIPDGEPGHRFEVGLEFGELAVNADPRLVRGYAERSLRELGTDRIDLYYPHFPDPEVPIEDTVGAVAELVAAGTVRHLGLSNVDAATLRRAHAVYPVSAVQAQWAMWHRPDHDLLEAADELGVGLVAWSPLGSGFLTGQVADLGEGDFRRNIDRFAHLAANNDRYAPVRSIADELGLTPAQLALAWLLHQHPHVVPIPGSRTPAHIVENLDAARVRLGDDELARVDAALAAFRPEGVVDVFGSAS